MSYTSGDIASRVQKRVRDTAYPVPDVIGFINDAQNAVANEYLLRFWEANPVTYTLSTSSQDITNGAGLPSDFVLPIDLLITTAGYECELDYVDYKELDRRYPNQANATANTPTCYYFYGNTINVFPKPNIAYTVKLRYQRMPTQLVNAADVPEIPVTHAEVLIYGGGYRIFEEKDMDAKAAIFQQKNEMEVAKLVSRYGLRAPTSSQTILKLARFRRHA